MSSDIAQAYQLQNAYTEDSQFYSNQYMKFALQRQLQEAGKAIIAAGSFFPKTKRAQAAAVITEEPAYNIRVYKQMYERIEILHEMVDKMAELMFHAGAWVKVPAHLRELEDFDISKYPALKTNMEFIRQWSRYIKFVSIGIDIWKSALWSGNAYIEIVYEPENPFKIKELKLINPEEMRVIRSAEGDILGYLQFPFKGGIAQILSQRSADRLKKRYPRLAIPFEPSEIIHIKYGALPGDAYGVSIFESLKDITAILVGMREDMGVIVRNNAAPTIFFGLGTELIPATQKTIDEFSAYLSREFDNSTNLVGSTQVHPEVIDTSSKVIDLPAYIRTAMNILYAGAGFPEILLGQGNETTEATARSQIEAFEKTLKANQQLFRDNIELSIFPYLCEVVKKNATTKGGDVYTFKLKPSDMDNIPELYFPPIETAEEKRLRLQMGTEFGILPHEVIRKEWGYSPKLEGTFVVEQDRDYQMELTKAGKVQQTGMGTKKDGQSTKNTKTKSTQVRSK